MYARDEEAATLVAEQAQEAARAVGAPWVEADALVTLGELSERGRPGRRGDRPVHRGA